MKLLAHQPRLGCHRCHPPGRAPGPRAAAVWNLAEHSQSSAPLGSQPADTLPLAPGPSSLAAAVPHCHVPYSPNSHLNFWAPISSSYASTSTISFTSVTLQDFIQLRDPSLFPSVPVVSGPVSQGSCVSGLPSAHSLLATPSLCHLLAAPSSPSGLPTASGPAVSVSSQVTEGSLPTLPMSCLLTLFLVAHPFTVGRGRGPQRDLLDPED